MTARSGRSSSRSSRRTCSSQIRTSSSGRRYPASVARPSGGNNEYLIGRKNGLVASVSAGRIMVTRMERGSHTDAEHPCASREDSALTCDVYPVRYHEGAAAAGVLRTGHPQLERVVAAGQHRAGEHQVVARAGGREEVDVLLRAAVDRHRTDAVLRVEHAVEGDLGTGEGDRGRVTGGVVPAVAVVEQAGVAARAAVLPAGTVEGEVGVV